MGYLIWGTGNYCLDKLNYINEDIIAFIDRREEKRNLTLSTSLSSQNSLHISLYMTRPMCIHIWELMYPEPHLYSFHTLQ